MLYKPSPSKFGGGYSIDDLAERVGPSGDITLTVTSLTSRVFYKTPITSVSAPNLTTISETFQGCEDLTSIDMPSLTTVSGNGTFADCKYLRTANLPNLTNLKNATFQSCMNLRDLWLPSVTKIEGAPFYGRTGWQSTAGCVLKLGSTVTSMSASAFQAFCYGQGDIYVPWSSGDVSGAPWSAPSGITIHYDTVYDANGNVISST